MTAAMHIRLTHLTRALIGLGVICMGTFAVTTSAAMTLTPASTTAEIDRLRMHADAGRDDQALAALLAVARTGNADAERALGEALLRRAREQRQGQRTQDALDWLQRAAAQGDVRAMLLLGKTWLLGAPNLAPDASKARIWFEHADPTSSPQAAYYLGLIEKGGYAQPADPVRAAEHFRFAALRSVPEAMYQLGNLYSSGEGVDSDPREAMRWYLRAAALDHPQAIQELANAFARGDTLLPQSDLQAANMRLAMEHALRHPASAP